ncbi:MAG: DNA-protecting protein DprA [Chloroflexi bacterium]|nr:DNA-protecting protein DprA [Chloroflexota bacterium]
MERQYWVGFSYVKGIGPTRVRQLLAYFGSLEEAWHAGRDALQEAGLDKRALKSLLETRPRLNTAGELARLDKLGIAVLTWEDEDYPPLLAELRAIDHAPPVIYMRGTLTQRDQWALAVVGTRRISAYGRQVTRTLVGDIARGGVTVISGMAKGIDAEAHQAALEAGARTIAVLPCGMDTIYPPEHRGLATQIVQQGAVLTQFPLGTKPEAGNFPPRNRTLSGLARGVLVIEAGHKSGALITANHALEQGREVFAVPGNITMRNSDGTNRLIRDGAHPVTEAHDVLEVLDMDRVEQHISAQQALPPMSDIEQTINDVLSFEPTHVDEIVQASGLPTNQVTSTLTMLVLKGLAQEVDTMVYVKTR